MNTFFTGLVSEFNKIKWPDAAVAFGHAALVIGIALLVGYYLGLLDAIFAYGIKFLIQ